MDRKLVAILAADVVGYSALMEADEAGTFDRLRAGRKELFEPEIARHHGRVFKLMGDGMLAEFGSVVDAVECAVALQRGLAERNASISEDRRFEVRIGINLGEVIVEGDDRYGEGVNVAARLQQLAEPGGICVSEKVSREVEKKLAFGFEPMGQQRVKNIGEPISCFRVTLEIPGSAQSDQSSRKPPKLPDKPAIAVLPFQNMSGDPEQEYFSDGLTEDIITELSRFKNLLVVARNSSFTFKGHAVDVKEIGRKLGARYVVEGSVRRAGNRIRITAQLVESATGNHLWAERYDREMEDIFAVQDELVRAISGVIPGQLDRYVVENLRRKPPDNLTAYDYELRGRWALTHWNEGLEIALEWFEKSAKADPNYALAQAGIALVCAYQIPAHGLASASTIARAKEYARRATVLDDRNPTVQAYAALAYVFSCEYELSRRHAERAVALNPNDSYALFVKACVLTYSGNMQEALEFFAKSERLDAYAPDDLRLDCLCDCHYMLHNYDKVIEIHHGYQNVPAFLYLILAAAAAQLGRQEQAREAVKDYERLRPAGHDAAAMINYQMRMCWRQEDREHWLDGYRKAGIQI
ncbi:MAG TPA: adenylate/guanylate cyclase domain-containing protein [Hyphomicrobiaceae bacterium]|nr:adenylate/guanylate cyclase domain-containing protein [Hyphomicrobiaceae bacterium]